MVKGLDDNPQVHFTQQPTLMLAEYFHQAVCFLLLLRTIFMYDKAIVDLDKHISNRTYWWIILDLDYLTLTFNL